MRVYIEREVPRLDPEDFPTEYDLFWRKDELGKWYVDLDEESIGTVLLGIAKLEDSHLGIAVEEDCMMIAIYDDWKE